MNIKHRGSLGILLAATLVPAMSIAGGWKVPENSINSTALSAAYVANAHGADAAYFNPAAMVFNKEGSSIEGNLTYIHLSRIQYTDLDAPSTTDKSKVENFLVPSFHYVGPSMGNTRFGLSVITPAGLSKRWSGVGRASAEEFTLETIEVNPSIAYKFNDRFSGAIGARMIYSSGVVKSYATLGPYTISRDLEGSSYDFGYNLALHFKPTNNLDLALTYRSKIDLTEEGDAELSAVNGSYSGDASVTIPVPAALNLAAAYDINDKTTIELVYERTYWSAYKELDFNYADSPLDFTGVVGTLGGTFDDPVAKNWSDSNTYRIGVTHQLDNKWTLMAGYAYDETPANKSTIGFELPDSDAHIFSIGARYQYCEDINIGFGLLYDKKDKLTITPSDGNGDFNNAEFKDASAILLTVGAQYTF
jgi:long-chain fatty acid transport protein